jgi:hypothetical protein
MSEEEKVIQTKKFEERKPAATTVVDDHAMIESGDYSGSPSPSVSSDEDFKVDREEEILGAPELEKKAKWTSGRSHWRRPEIASATPSDKEPDAGEVKEERVMLDFQLLAFETDDEFA